MKVIEYRWPVGTPLVAKDEAGNYYDIEWLGPAVYRLLPRRWSDPVC